MPGTGGVVGRLGWAAQRADARPGRLAHRGVPDLRQSRTGRPAPNGVFPPAADGRAPPGATGAGLEPLYLHRWGCGGVSSAGSPAREIDMAREVFAGDQAGELGQHPRQSRTGDRGRGCRGMGRGGCERHAADLRWLPRRSCPGAPANWFPRRRCSSDPGKRRDLLEKSCGRSGYEASPHIRRREAVSDRQSVLGLLVIPRPALALVQAVVIA
jgi:hypothetical protein